MKVGGEGFDILGIGFQMAANAMEEEQGILAFAFARFRDSHPSEIWGVYIADFTSQEIIPNRHHTLQFLLSGSDSLV